MIHEFKTHSFLAVSIFKLSCNHGCYILIKHTMSHVFKTDRCFAVVYIQDEL